MLAIAKSFGADILDLAAQEDSLQLATTGEQLGLHQSQALAQPYVAQRFASGKSRFADGSYRVRNIQIAQVFAIRKCFTANRFKAIWQVDSIDARLVESIRADSQHLIRMALIRYACRDSDMARVLGIPLFIAAVVRHYPSRLLVAIKLVVDAIDLGHAIRDILAQCRMMLVVLLDKVGRHKDGLQAMAVLEGIQSDRCFAMQMDAAEVETTQEGLILDAGDRRGYLDIAGRF